MTAKHNLEADDGEEYMRVCIQFVETGAIGSTMSNGGCNLTDCIEVRPATEDVAAIQFYYYYYSNYNTTTTSATTNDNINDNTNTTDPTTTSTIILYY